MGKFKIGDRVKVVHNNHVRSKYAVIEDTGVIKAIDTGLSGEPNILVDFDVPRPLFHNANGLTKQSCGYWCYEDMLIKEVKGIETIVIYRKDNKMIAVDRCTGKRAVAKCAPEDDFNYLEGARIAFNRLLEENHFKVLCVKDVKMCGKTIFNAGKLYKYVNGRCLDCENGFKSFGYGSFEELISRNIDYKGKLFEVKEVNRLARVGEYVKVVDAKDVPETAGKPDYKNGDIIRIIKPNRLQGVRYSYATSSNDKAKVLFHSEYVVLEGDYPKNIDDITPHDIGSTVKVVDENRACMYDECSPILKGYETNYVMGKLPKRNKTYKLLRLEKHVFSTRTVALIQNPNTTQVFIIYTEGIEKC